jgi:hypothetical protein
MMIFSNDTRSTAASLLVAPGHQPGILPRIDCRFLYGDNLGHSIGLSLDAHILPCGPIIQLDSVALYHRAREQSKDLMSPRVSLTPTPASARLT